ncbi:MAG: endolytic transglycosylase MltG [Burkholderiaceae bacterium]|nr:endolytic transglycosylase MltG [Burkholderiaceae bacterium]
MKRTLTLLCALFLAAGALAAYGWYLYGVAPLPMDSAVVRIRVERGMGLEAIAAQARSQGVALPELTLKAAARLRGDARSIKAGVYQLSAPLTLRELLDRMVRGDVVMAEVTIVEGWTWRQMRLAIDRHPDLSHDTAGQGDDELLARIGAPQTHPEGLFFPSTYRFSPGSSDLEIYRQSYQRQASTLSELWEGRQADLPLSDPYQALVLASIVEKETGRTEDRARVAAVFVNRLRLGMRLQSDPTTIYGLGAAFDGNLRKRDLLQDTAYNTYTRAGLPPTPIALPGRASVAAVLNPAQTRALYFVARGDGSSEFSDNLDAHNRAVARYQLRR